MSSKESTVTWPRHTYQLSVHLLEQWSPTDNTFIYSRIFVVCEFPFKGTDKKINRSSKDISKASITSYRTCWLKIYFSRKSFQGFCPKMRTDQTYGKLNHTNILQIYVSIIKCAYNYSKTSTG